MLKAEIFHPTDDYQITEYIRSKEALLARGNGRCYGDAALSPTLVSTLGLNKIISFDSQRGWIDCQAGVLFSDILELIVPAGFFLPVTPGTKFITVGGAIAADVHGKNHHKEGCFSQFLSDFEIITENGEHVQCSKEQNTVLFQNTIGGMGLTGMITRASFFLKKIETSFIRQEIMVANSLEEVMDLFESSKDWTYTMAWIDILKMGKGLGRSILFRGEHASLEELSSHLKSKPLTLKKRFKLNVPFYLPSFVLNNFSVQAFNALYFRMQKWSSPGLVHFEPFFYPLDAIHNWNRIYSRKGFTQYQLVLPKNKSKEGLKEILACIQRFKQGSFLSVLKLFGRKNPDAPNSFPIEGYTLSMDFKINSKTHSLIKELDKIVRKNNGKIYLAKDAFSSADLSGFDLSKTNDKFDSLLKQRLKSD